MRPSLRLTSFTKTLFACGSTSILHLETRWLVCAQTNNPTTNAEWLVPPSPRGFGTLDPCAPGAMQWQTAAHRHARRDDRQPWFGRCRVNPPYSSSAAAWLRKLREHGNGIALVPARAATRIFVQARFPGARICVLRISDSCRGEGGTG